MLEFDEATTRMLEDVYQGSDATRRRMANFMALAPVAGQRILDIGCGPGMLTLELSRAVGPEGEVLGVDPSEAMRETAAKRTTGRENVSILEGTANALPVEDASCDGAVSVQVFEYVEDIPDALAEARRALRPDTRLVIGDFHWDSLAWSTGHPERMARVIAAWDDHLAERCVPALLPAQMRAEGFAVEAVTPFVISDTTLRPDGIAGMVLRIAEKFAVAQGGIDAGEARAWAGEQQALAEEGRFFFSLTHFIVSARRV